MNAEIECIRREHIEEYFQFVTTIIATKGVKQTDSEFRVYTKEEILKRLEELLPNEHKYSVITMADEKEKGLWNYIKILGILCLLLLYY